MEAQRQSPEAESPWEKDLPRPPHSVKSISESTNRHSSPPSIASLESIHLGKSVNSHAAPGSKHSSQPHLQMGKLRLRGLKNLPTVTEP